ncbi:Zinc finger CCHC-type [Arabidopsis thaliana x Arabidopsis arenosa]|uniref:Zinc finger CCHC-type n=1 Tax=Arabidopsis thaliana x Arabidopsis arenosa TaxID=1240361 RepID=A0A8T1ZLN6_9BRAS|nr:Zinc finger CCHC-type [Arabidopsis thaliana x Arabidopsis arenosa]
MESTKDLELDKELVAEEQLEAGKQLEPEEHFELRNELIAEKEYGKDVILTSLVAMSTTKERSSHNRNKRLIEALTTKMGQIFDSHLDSIRQGHHRARKRKEQELKSKPPDNSLRSTRSSPQKISHTPKSKSVCHSDYKPTNALFKFSGNEDYLEWEKNMDEWFSYINFLSEMRFVCALSHLTGDAYKWWLQEVEDRLYYKEPPITFWRDLKELLRKKYAPQASNRSRKVNVTAHGLAVQEKGQALVSDSKKNPIAEKQFEDELLKILNAYNKPKKAKSTPQPKMVTEEVVVHKQSLNPSPESSGEPKQCKSSNLSKKVTCYKCRKKGHLAATCHGELELTISSLESKLSSSNSSSEVINQGLENSSSCVMHLFLSKDVDSGHTMEHENDKAEGSTKEENHHLVSTTPQACRADYVSNITIFKAEILPNILRGNQVSLSCEFIQYWNNFTFTRTFKQPVLNVGISSIIHLILSLSAKEDAGTIDVCNDMPTNSELMTCSLAIKESEDVNNTILKEKEPPYVSQQVLNRELPKEATRELGGFTQAKAVLVHNQSPRAECNILVKEKPPDATPPIKTRGELDLRSNPFQVGEDDVTMESTKDLELDKELVAEEQLEAGKQLEPEEHFELRNELIAEKEYGKDVILTSLVAMSTTKERSSHNRNKRLIEALTTKMGQIFDSHLDSIRQGHHRARKRKEQELKSKPPDNSLRSTRSSPQKISHTPKSKSVCHSDYKPTNALFKFSGKEDYLEWEKNMDEWFSYINFLSEMRFVCALSHLTGDAYKWWLQEVEDRLYYKEPPITFWRDLKELLRKKYAPQASNRSRKVNVTAHGLAVQEKGQALVSDSKKNPIAEKQFEDELLKILNAYNKPKKAKSTPQPKMVTEEVVVHKQSLNPSPESSGEPKQCKSSNLSKKVTCYKCRKKGHLAATCHGELELTISSLESKLSSSNSSSEVINQGLENSSSCVMHLFLSKDVDSGHTMEHENDKAEGSTKEENHHLVSTTPQACRADYVSNITIFKAEILPNILRGNQVSLSCEFIQYWNNFTFTRTFKQPVLNVGISSIIHLILSLSAKEDAGTIDVCNDMPTNSELMTCSLAIKESEDVNNTILKEKEPPYVSQQVLNRELPKEATRELGGFTQAKAVLVHNQSPRAECNILVKEKPPDATPPIKTRGELDLRSNPFQVGEDDVTMESTKDLELDKELVAEEQLEAGKQLEPEEHFELRNELIAEKEYLELIWDIMDAKKRIDDSEPVRSPSKIDSDGSLSLRFSFRALHTSYRKLSYLSNGGGRAGAQKPPRVGLDQQARREVDLFKVFVMHYNDLPEEEEDIFGDNIQDEEYVEQQLDENVLTLEQKVKLDELYKENPTLTRSDLAALIRLNLLSLRAALEGRELTFYEIREAHALEKVIYWVPPSELEGTCNSTFEIYDFEDIHMPCIEDMTSSLHTPFLIDECYDLICESQRLDILRAENVSRDYHELCFDIEYHCALNVHDLEFKFSMPELSRSLLEESYLGVVLDIDKILHETENTEVDYMDGDVVLYEINGDEVDYFVKTSFKPEIDFIFPLDAFDSHSHPTIKEYFKVYAPIVVIVFDVYFISLPCPTLCYLADVFSYTDRRRTKAPKEADEEEEKEEKEAKEATIPEEDKWFQEDQAVLALLQNSLEASILEGYSYCETAKELWDTLKNVYGNESNLTRVFEVKKAINELSQEDLEFTKHFGKFRSLWSELESLRPGTLDPKILHERREQDKVFGLLLTLNPSYNDLIKHLLRSEKLPTLDEVCSQIQKEQGSSGLFGGKGELAMANKGEAGGKQRSIPTRRQEVHDDKTIKINPGSSKSGGEASTMSSGDYVRKSDLEALIKSIASLKESGITYFSHQPSNSSMVIDSGASHHMISNPNLLNNIEPALGNVIIANGDKVPIKGIGNLRVFDRNSKAFYMPKFTSNLLSVKRATKDLNCYAIFGPNDVYFQDIETGKLIGEGGSKGELYVLEDASPSSNTSPISFKSHLGVSFNVLWHARLGHPHSRALKLMLPSISFDHSSCEACILGKHCKSVFPKSFTIYEKCFDLVHSDVWTSPCVSRDNNKYFVTFIDEKSKYTWITLLPSKDRVFEAFTNFQNYVTNQFNAKIKVLRTDNGGEYTSHKFKEHLAKHGIIHQTSCPYTPQQNGVAERKNRHLMEVARSMMFHTSVPRRYWGDAVMTACYLINRTPTKVLKDLSPFEVLNNTRPSIDHLRVFGCVCFVLVPGEQRNKLDAKSTRCMFLGYSTTQKGYKCYDPTSNRTFVSRDVKFLEDQGYTNKKDWEDLKDLAHSTTDRAASLKFLLDHLGNQSPSPRDNARSSQDSTQSSQPSTRSSHDPELQENESQPNNVPHDEDKEEEEVTIEPNSSNQEEETSLQDDSSESSDEEEEIVQCEREPTPPLRRSKRVRYHPSNWKNTRVYFNQQAVAHPIQAMCSLALVPQDHQAFQSKISLIKIPETYEEAMQTKEWRDAVEDEIGAMKRNHTWDEEKLPSGKKTVSSKWVFTIKYKSNGDIERYKARLVARGFTQTYGADYKETFAPVAKLHTVRVVLSLATNLSWDLWQMDVKNAFLQGELEDDVYMTPPPGLEATIDPGKVWRLRKAIYGLKQSPRAWYHKLSRTLKDHGFKKSESDHTLFTLRSSQGIVVVLIYVDDLIISGDNKEGIISTKAFLKSTFDIKDLGELKYFLGIEVCRSPEGLFLSQRKYTLDLLHETGSMDAKPAKTPLEEGYKVDRKGEHDEKFQDAPLYRKLVGKLIYLTNTRPDICFAVNQVSQHMQAPTVYHWSMVERILRYLKGTSGQGIWMGKNSNTEIVGYCDADYAGDRMDRRSTTGYCTFIGGNLVTWKTKKQKVVSCSSAESEYRAMKQLTNELTWLKALLKDFGVEQDTPITMHCDNKAAIYIASNSVFHERTKHIEVDCHKVREKIVQGVTLPCYTRSEDQLADIFTKAASLKVFNEVMLHAFPSLDYFISLSLRGSIDQDTIKSENRAHVRTLDRTSSPYGRDKPLVCEKAETSPTYAKASRGEAHEPMRKLLEEMCLRNISIEPLEAKSHVCT